MSDPTPSKRIAARFALIILPIFVLGSALVVLWLRYSAELAGHSASGAEAAACAVQAREQAKQLAELSDGNKALQEQSDRLSADNQKLSGQLALERAAPRGSLGDFFLDYERFSQGLRFDVEVQVEYQVHWRLDLEEGQAPKQVRKTRGKSILVQGVLLGRRSNFAFGLVMIEDLSPALHCPTADTAFDPPAPEVLDKRWYWKDKKAEFVMDDPGITRVLYTRLRSIGSDRLAQPVDLRVVRARREPNRGFTVLVLGQAGAAEGVDPGPAYVAEQAWMSLTERLGVFPMTAPNGGIVLHKEHMGEAYRRDKHLRPSVNRAWDYFRDGWVRADWDGTPGRIEVLFAPLPEGEGGKLVPQVHSLVFPMLQRQSLWLPFWAVRERLIAPAALDLSILPTLNIESRHFDYKMDGVPMQAAGEWQAEAFSTSLYDLLKRRPSTQ